jgi:hypothetical protein
MKYKILSISAGAAAAILLFASAFIFAELHFVKSALTGYKSPPAIEEPAVAAFAAYAEDAVEVYNVITKGKDIVVYTSDGSVAMTIPLPDGLPADARTTLNNGITVFGREALLIFLEDFAE